jgi:hypothetical protein
MGNDFWVVTRFYKFAGTTSVLAPDKAAPDFRVTLALTPTLWVELVVHDKQGNPMPSRKFHIEPKVADEDFPLLRRDVQSDEEGLIRLDGVVPGLSYRVQEDVPPQAGQLVAPVGARPPWFDEVLILVPKSGK